MIAEQSCHQSHSCAQLWLLRATCFIQFFSVGILWAYQTVWMKERGMGEFFIGQVQALSTVLTLIGGFAYGYLADVTGRPVRIMVAGCVLTSASLVYFARCVEPVDFVIYSVIAGLSMPMMQNMLPLLAVSVLEGGGAGRKYGAYRVFGSIGYSISTLVLPRVIGDIGYLLRMSAVVLLLAPLPALLVRSTPPARVDHPHSRIGSVLRNRELVGFFVAVFFFGLAAPAIFRFTPIYARQLGADQAFIGLLGAALGLVSIVALPMSGWAVDRYGPRLLLLLALVAQPVRVLCLSFVTRHDLILLPRLLHIFTFAGLEVAAMLYVTRLAGPQSRGTALAIYAGSHVLARAFASVAAGYLAEEFSYTVMYRASAVAATIGLVIFVALSLAGRTRRNLNGDASRVPAQ